MLKKVLLLTMVATLAAAMISAKAAADDSPDALWEKENPIEPVPDPPLGIGEFEEFTKLTEFPEPPTPETVRLGRWLFYDSRLSADNTISCASCHKPANAFSETTPTSTGIRGQKGGRKAPSFINQAWTVYPHFFWDGRADSLEAQAKGPIVNPIEMGMSDHDMVVEKVRNIEGYRPYFEEAFGSPEIDIDRMAKAIADYERTRMSGNSAWDRWRAGEEDAVSEEVKKGHDLFFGRARCNNCHLGQNFTDSDFHNLGIGWDPETESFADEGRKDFTGKEEDAGRFKTPTLRDVTKHPPFMHDGSMETLREVIEHYNVGGTPNPWLDAKVSFETSEELNLTEEEIDQLIAFMEALEGEGYMDVAPKYFPPDHDKIKKGI